MDGGVWAKDKDLDIIELELTSKWEVVVIKSKNESLRSIN